MTQRMQDADGQAGTPPAGRDAGSDDPTGAWAFGLRVEQLDALERSLRMIAAHGDLLACVRAIDLAAGTLPVIGQAVHDEAQAMQAVLTRIGEQRPGSAADARGGVEEARAGYGKRGPRPGGVMLPLGSPRSLPPRGHLHLVREGGAPVGN